jgi:hypothetical protein
MTDFQVGDTVSFTGTIVNTNGESSAIKGAAGTTIRFNHFELELVARKPLEVGDSMNGLPDLPAGSVVMRVLNGNDQIPFIGTGGVPVIYARSRDGSWRRAGVGFEEVRREAGALTDMKFRVLNIGTGE